jgi:hypothetical protein
MFIWFRATWLLSFSLEVAAVLAAIVNPNRIGNYAQGIHSVAAYLQPQ